MDYKICILAAGIGSMSELTKDIHHSILPVNFKATLSYIFEKFPKDVEVVIAVGYKKETIKEYCSLAHPDRKITYVDIEKYFGPGTGPGQSLLECRPHLNCPFVFFAADTIVLEEVPNPDRNWFGIAPVKKTEDFCTVRIKNNLIYHLDDKVKVDNKFAFIGLAGVRDYDVFFNALEQDKTIKKGEIQVSNGFSKLIEKKLVPIGFTWFDTGRPESYKETNKSFSEGSKFDFSKSNEFIYFVNNKIVKYFANPEIIEKRYKRAQILKGLCPDIEAKTPNFYSYERVPGQVLYDVLNSSVVTDFFEWSKNNIWRKIDISKKDQKVFNQACMKFYYGKTMKRLDMFYDKLKVDDTQNNINGVVVPPLKDMFDKINWDELYKGVPVKFHGDLQFDNILVTRDPKSNLSKFALLDWRQDFGGLTDYGDLYYDLSKLYGGVTLSYKEIKAGNFSFDRSGTSVYYNFSVKNDLLDAKEEYESFLDRNKFDMEKIKILRALIYLNMSPLHHTPFDLMLYYMGKVMLYKALKEFGRIK